MRHRGIHGLRAGVFPLIQPVICRPNPGVEASAAAVGTIAEEGEVRQLCEELAQPEAGPRGHRREAVGRHRQRRGGRRRSGVPGRARIVE